MKKPWFSVTGRCPVLNSDSRLTRRDKRVLRRLNLTALEGLESRQLMAFSNLGFSLPDLIVTGEAGPKAAWGGTISVSGFLQNIGASTITEPTEQAPPTELVPPGNGLNTTNSSTSDAPTTSIAIFITPHRNTMRGAILLATTEAPPIEQNSVQQFQTAEITLPARPRGFARPGGTFYIRLMANSSGTSFEANPENNLSQPIPVKVVHTALPALRAIMLSTPPVMQPGDTISPTIQIENFGTADTNTPVQVALVASVTPSFTVGSSIVFLTTINTNIPALSNTPTSGNPATFGAQNLLPPNNVVTFTVPPVTLPTSPSVYFLGVVVDPFGNLNQLTLPRNAFEQIHVVGPPIPHLPPAGVINTGNAGVFPTAADGQLIGNVD
jgi:hypothetical protein